MKTIGGSHYKAQFFLLLSLLLFPALSRAAGMNDYCVVPAFLNLNVPTNLLLMVDNSASMYDLAYQDTANMYCANAPTTSCTAGTTCAGAATCNQSGVTTTTHAYAQSACTADSQCPNSTGQCLTSRTITSYTAKACTLDSQCPNSGNPKCTNQHVCKTCNTSTGAGDCTPSTYAPISCTANATCSAITAGDTCTQKCQSGYCRTCNTSTGVGDCTDSPTVTFAPTSCTTDATCSAITPGDTCNNKCNVNRQCYDTSYSSSATYNGYFVAASTYYYDFTNGFFTSGAAWPGTCTYSAGTPKYVCVNTSGTPEDIVTTGTTGFVATGNFLNWMTTSKFDIEKQILTGGKYDTGHSELIGESRGCAGRKFLKSVPGMSLTFAIRGGTAGGISSTQSQASEYGQTYVEIYTGTYNASDCLKAMNDWMNVTGPSAPQLGAFQNDTKGCVGSGNGVLNGTSVWNHILHDCYQGLTGGAQGYSTNLGSLEGECQSMYASMARSAMTDPNAGYAVCSSVLSYTDMSGTAQTGYLGACYNGTSFSSPCDVTQMQNYCQVNVSGNPVVDPTSTVVSGSGQSAPGFILEQGLMNTNLLVHGILPVKVGLAPAPTGLVQKYQNRIRFGAMQFNNNGSGSECGTNSLVPCAKACSVTKTRICFFDTDCPASETCSPLTHTDGGKILSFIGNSGYCSTTNTTLCSQNSDCPAGETCNLAGDHNVGLINKIDNIVASSWTPFAEAYYNAIAYYVNGANTVSTLDATKYTPDTASATSSITSYLTGSDSYVVGKCSVTTGTSCTRTDQCPSGEQCAMNPIQYKCQSNNVLLVTDGSSTTDSNSTMTGKVTGSSGYFRDPATTSEAAACGSYSGSPYIHDLSYFANQRNIFTPSQLCSTTPCDKAQTIKTYVVYNGSAASAGLSGICDPQTQMQKTATNGGTTLYQASSYPTMYTAIDQALQAMAGGEASSTAASILSNSAGSGANILQAVFYPKKTFGNDAGGNPTSANWIGEMLDLWYYVDPFINHSTMREDNTFVSGSTHTLDLKNNNILTFSFDTNPADTTYNQAVVQRSQDVHGDGSVVNPLGSAVTPDNIQAIWRAGALLQTATAGSRNIYTPCLSGASCDGTGTNLMDFSTTSSGNLTLLQPILQASSTDSNAEATKIVNWVKGTEQTGYRSRTVNNNGTTAVWKLGDIISSTPRIQSSVKLNLFDLPAPAGYKDVSYGAFAAPTDTNGNPTRYGKRGMAYVGANDGMLHAFKLGVLNVTPSGTRKATLSGDNLGSEQWAFIPSNALPYLRYLTCVAGGNDNTYCNNQDYGHLYTVDGSTVVTDASIKMPASCSAAHYWQCDRDESSGTNWGTVLVGGMGVGGASKDNTDGCTPGAAGSCVKSPLAGFGNSSYFALDITNEFFDSNGTGTLNTLGQPPKFMWEFSDASITDSTKKGLGFAAAGAAIVRVSARDGANGLTGNPVKTKNGRWFAVFGSGPTGPIDTTNHYFLGTSNQNLKIYIVDLNATMPWISDGTSNSNYWVLDSNIPNAFVSSMSGAPIDTERWKSDANGNYQDNALYFGYVQTDSGTTPAWTHGGVLRLITGNDSTGENPDPSTWTLSKVITLNEPVTTGIARLQDRQNHNLWLYFGTGRYFYSQDDMLSSSAMSNSTLVAANRRHIYGLIEPCYTHTSADALNMTCTATPINASDPTSSTANLADQSDITHPQDVTGKNGWFITLDAQAGTSGAERAVTDAVAMTNGGIFFSTFKPTSDPCTMGGNSFLWAVNYNTGLAPPPAALKGQVMFQLSTGEFKQVSLSDANVFSDMGGRRTGSNWTGKPPSDPPPIISTSNLKPVKKILHIQEK